MSNLPSTAKPMRLQHEIHLEIDISQGQPSLVLSNLDSDYEPLSPLEVLAFAAAAPEIFPERTNSKGQPYAFEKVYDKLVIQEGKAIRVLHYRDNTSKYHSER